MQLSQISKILHAARLTVDGTFKSQRAACLTLDISPKLMGRVSDAHTMLIHGCPELIAAVEGGHIAFQTAWQIALRFPRDEQPTIVKDAQQGRYDSRGRQLHGLYTGRANEPAQLFHYRHKQHDRVCEAVDKLLDAIMERATALGVCTNGTRPAPEAEQGRQWRITIRRLRKALMLLEQKIDWTKTENAYLETLESKSSIEGDRQNDDTDNDNGPQNSNNSGPQD